MLEVAWGDRTGHCGDAKPLLHGREDAQQASAGIHEAIGMRLALQGLFHDRSIDTPLWVRNQRERAIGSAVHMVFPEYPLEVFQAIVAGISILMLLLALHGHGNIIVPFLVTLKDHLADLAVDLNDDVGVDAGQFS